MNPPKKIKEEPSEYISASSPNQNSIRSNLASRETIIPHGSFPISHAESSQIQLIFSSHGEETLIKYSAGGDGPSVN